MKKIHLFLVALLFFTTVTPTRIQAGEPMCHVLICCKSCNNGIKFLINGEWNANHDYRDIDQVRSIMQNIKDAGINTIIVDLTNPSQWEWLWDSNTLPALEKIQQVCVEKNMQYLIHIGGGINPAVREQENIPDDVSDLEYWDSKAKYISDNWASADTYRKYGFGDDRPMLLIFTPGEEYWGMDASEPAENKVNLEKFYRGTMQVNNELYDYQRQETSGWGYRKTNYNTSKTIRYTSPQGGVAPQSWHKVTAEKFETDVQWVSEAAEYSVYGSYDDTCDGIQWGIADTKNSNTLNPYWQPGDAEVYYNRYPNGDPFVYYEIIKKQLNPGTVTTPPAHLFATTVSGVQQVKLDWANNTETEFTGTYKVYRSEQSGGPYFLTSQPTISNYTDDNVELGKKYFYVVTALGSSETSYSNEVKAMPDVLDTYGFKFDFNTTGDAEGWIGNDHVGGLIQKISTNGTDGVLKSENGVQGNDPMLHYSNGLLLPTEFSSWDKLEIRFRQLDSDGNAQTYNPAGTIVYIISGVHTNHGNISEPAFKMEFEAQGEWVKATLDLSSYTNESLNNIRVDLRGDDTDTGANFELDYVYFPGILVDLAIDDSKLTKSPVSIYPNPAYNTLNIETPEQSEIEIFNYLGQKVYQQDAISGAKELNIGSWDTGMYMIRIKTNQQEYIQKMIKK